MAKHVTWLGGDAHSRALQDHGYPLTVEPGRKYELPDDVADSLVASTDSWQECEPETVDEIAARIEGASDEELARLASDERKGVQKAVEHELASRAEPVNEAPGEEPAPEGAAD